ncbi:MAG: alcohol dehydrogenase [Bacteroidetes bacterium]|jgi:NADPH:quinone reductase-like Zn-dependent oxidoreductase|nr:alcohol dehydrogenase [Bacteroidota bacterium]|tara:strand:+ start:601 stop:1560 length:960 start_codon:yes stop_codon:yes gene_type:complete
MKAIVYEKYGSTDELKLKEIQKPTPKDDEVLIKVHAVSPNASDVEFVKGDPLYTRMWGLTKPKNKILGSDIAGTIETIGSKVVRFQVGEAVFGDILGTWGGFAEYVCAPENALTLKPESLTFELASTLPQPAVVALQGIQNFGQVQAGQKVLINGAGGGSGTFAVQIAKLLGAEVTGVDSTKKLTMMESLGADHVIDYMLEDVTKNGEQYDLILDLVAAHSVFDYKRILSPKGKYYLVGGSVSYILKTMIFGAFISLNSKRKMQIIGIKPNQGLEDIIELIDSGKIKSVIDKRYSLSEVPEAMQYLSEGLAIGKVVIAV